MSVWVEIALNCTLNQNNHVTLHVSVWVEISVQCHTNSVAWSRSTWACELKYLSFSIKKGGVSHAPRERVSWNHKSATYNQENEVTLHVSVWVEMNKLASLMLKYLVTLHVSVWVEIWELGILNAKKEVTLHVSVWVEIFYSRKMRYPYTVTLHVSVWVEILCTVRKIGLE